MTDRSAESAENPGVDPIDVLAAEDEPMGEDDQDSHDDDPPPVVSPYRTIADKEAARRQRAPRRDSDDRPAAFRQKVKRRGKSL